MTSAADILRSAGITTKFTAPGRYYATCPRCSLKRKPAHQKLECLGITIDEKGVTWGCNHCGWKGGNFYEPRPVGKKNGSGYLPVIAQYVYKQADGTPYLKVCKTANKKFLQFRWNGSGWIAGKPKGPKIPYRLPELLATSVGTTIYFCEGEKDADAPHALHLIGTTCSEGAPNGWRDVHHRDGKWLLKCPAGCTWEAIIAAMGVAPGDLFDQSEGKGAGHPRNNRATAQLPGLTLEQYAAASNVLMALIDEGLPCFPCHLNKKPATPHGYKDATSNRETAIELWMRYPAPLIGVPTGELSGLDVLDIDQRHSGDSWLQQRRARLPTTRVHQTRSGGFHLFFQHESGLRCSAGRIATGVDVRADGGYVIWWPGVGLPVTSKMPVAPWPNWLLQQFSSSPRRISSRIRVPDDHALVHLIRLVASARDGERNNLTFWAACRAGEMVRSGLLRAEDAAALIAEAATRAGLPRPEAERTAWNGIRMTGGLSYA